MISLFADDDDKFVCLLIWLNAKSGDRRAGWLAGHLFVLIPSQPNFQDMYFGFALNDNNFLARIRAL
jgi:GTP-dependent phosphoenolpyruvate carboxykinase